jgi:hypothetical protein
LIFIYEQLKIKKMEELFCIREACGGPVVSGCESMTMAQVEEWFTNNDNEQLEETAECADTAKYIFMPVSQFNEPA